MSDRRKSPDQGVRGFLVDIFARALRPRPTQTIGQWAEGEHLMIPPEESHGAPGEYREATEPVATIVHQFVQDPRYRVFIGLKPSRMGFTLAAFVAIGFWLEHFMTNIILCIDDQRQVKKLARERLIPLLKSIRCLRDVMPTSKRLLTAMVLWLKGRTIHLAGARSIADVTSITAGLVIGDEVDQWKDFATGEASAFWHLLDRIMDVPGAKAAFFGKPRNETDILYTQYLTGSRHHCFVPCPHCGMMQVLKWDQLKFDHCKQENGNFDITRVLREVYYLCASPACQQTESGGRIYERHKPQMLTRREWRQTYFGDDPEYQLDPSKMSVSINQLYSLRPELTWGEIAKHFITARKEGGTALAHFFRTRFGEPERKAQAITKKEEILILTRYAPHDALRAWWLANQATIRPGLADTSHDAAESLTKEESALLKSASRRPYKHGQCPWKPAVVLMFCDVQTALNEKKWVKMAFRDTGECAIIDYGIFVSFAQLIPEADKPVKIMDWGDTPEIERADPVTAYIWIDEGGGDKNEIAVREFCVRPDTDGRFFPSKGAGGAQIKHVVEEHTREIADRDGIVQKICAYHFSHDTFASELYYERIKKHEKTLLALAQGIEPEAHPMWLPEFPDDQFVTELCSERLVKKKVRGKMEYIWQKTGQRVNDFQDGAKGCLAMWHFLKKYYIRASSDAGAADPPVDTPPPQQTRDYVLKRPS
jgi:phage terminase large subunit GpA-like protein